MQQFSVREREHHSWRMLRWVALAFAGLIVSIVFLVAAVRAYGTGDGWFAGTFRSVAKQAGPRIQVPQERISFGTPAQALTKQITIKNEGGGILSIASIQSSCPCITFQVPTTGIKAGKTLELALTLDPAKAPKKGEQAFIVSVESNALNTRTLDLVVTTNLK